MLKKLAWVFAVVLIVIGLCSLVPAFAPGGSLFGILYVDVMLAVIYIVTGMVAAGAAWTGNRTRLYFKVFGVVFAIFTIAGFVQGDTVLGLFATNTTDNLLDLIIAALALWAGFGAKEAMPMQAGARM